MLSLLRREPSEPSEPSGLVEDMEDPQDYSSEKKMKIYDLCPVGPQDNMGVSIHTCVCIYIYTVFCS